MNSSAGKEMKLPPPANAFSVPAMTAAKNKKMAWARCKFIPGGGARFRDPQQPRTANQARQQIYQEFSVISSLSL